MVTVGELVEAVYDVVQLPDDDKTQEAVLNTPPEPPSFHITLPLGVVVPLVSATVAANVTCPPEFTVKEFGVTVVVVVSKE